MMKKKLLVAIFTLAFLAGTMGMASANPNLASTNELGSVLIFPFVTVIDPTVGDIVDTVITIANTHATTAVDVKCYWVYKDYVTDDDDDLAPPECEHWDFQFEITPNQPVFFSAKSGRGMDSSLNPILVPAFRGDVGELKCWAVRPQDHAQIRHDRLKGEATVVNYTRTAAASYPAWTFQAHRANFHTVVGTPYEIKLSGQGPGEFYDACPKYLWFDFFATAEGPPYEPDPAGNQPGISNGIDPALITSANALALSPCIEDLRQGGPPTLTKLEFDIYDENELKYTGVSDCLYCWYWDLLEDVDVTFTDNYQYGLKTDAGLFKVWGIAHADCDVAPYTAVDVGLVGVHISSFYFTQTGSAYEIGLKAVNGWAEGLQRDGIIYY
jgi:hypothetical protein